MCVVPVCVCLRAAKKFILLDYSPSMYCTLVAVPKFFYWSQDGTIALSGFLSRLSEILKLIKSL